MSRLLILAIALCSGMAAAATLTMRVSVVDGDTLELADGKRVRLWGIDAVEGSQVCPRDGQPWRCGDDATAALRRLIDGRKLACDAREVDRYGRVVAVCRVDGADIGAEMVRQGWALDERYSRGAYADEQKAAWAERAGLWAGEFVPPWEWRKAQRNRASTDWISPARGYPRMATACRGHCRVAGDGSGRNRTMKKHWLCATLALVLMPTPAAAACQDSDLGGRWQIVINFPGVAPGGSVRNGPGFGFVLSCELRLANNGQIRANQSSCVELSDGFEDPDATEEFAPGQGRLRVSRSCSVTGAWGSNEIIGALGADKVTLIGAIEWSDGDVGTFTAVRPGR